MSMGGSLGVDITGNSQAGEAALDRTSKKLDQLTAKTKQATLAQKDLNAEMGKQLRAGSMAARGTGAAAGLGAAAGGVAVGGTMGMLAVGAAASAVVFQMVKRLGDLAEESARRRLGYEQDIADAAGKAKEARGASAERGMGQEQAYRKALFAGGHQAIARADAMIKNGIDPAEAYSAAADSQGAASKYGNQVIQDLLAQIAHRGGDVSGAAKKLKDRPWMAESSSAATNLMGLRPGESDNWVDWGRADATVAADPYLQQAEAGRRLHGQRDLADRQNTTDGFALPGRQREVMQAKAPEFQAKQDAIEKITKGIESMEKMAATQSKGFRILADVFSPGGSFETMMIRAMRDRDHVLAGDP